MDSLTPHGKTEHDPAGRRPQRTCRVRRAALLCAAAWLVLLPAAEGRRSIKAQDLAGSLAGLAAMSEGQKLVEQGSPESVNKGIEKLKQAAALFKKARMKDGEVAALLTLGQAYSQLDENFKSLEYFEQAAATTRREIETLLSEYEEVGAQIEMSQGAGSESPYYWAAFVLQGEWN